MRYVDLHKVSELYNKVIHRFLKEKSISIHHFENKGNPLITRIFIKTLNNVISTYKALVGQENACVDILLYIFHNNYDIFDISQ